MNGQNLVHDEVADETGGHAFYGSNDLAGDSPRPPTTARLITP